MSGCDEGCRDRDLHRKWPENASCQCYHAVFGATYDQRFARPPFEVGQRVVVREKYVAGGFCEADEWVGHVFEVHALRPGNPFVVYLRVEDATEDDAPVVELFTSTRLDAVPASDSPAR